MSETFFILDQSPAIYRSVRLDKVIAKKVRRLILKVSFFLFIISGAISALYLVRHFWGPADFLPAGKYSGYFGFTGYLPDAGIVAGVFLICCGFLFFLLFLEFFYVANLRPSPVLDKDGEVFSIDYDAASVFYNFRVLGGGEIPGRVFWQGVLKDGVLNSVFYRVGISQKDLEGFRSGLEEYSLVKEDLLSAMMSISSLRKIYTIGLAELVEAIFVIDKKLEKFLFDCKIRREDIKGAALWVATLSNYLRKRELIWGKPVLSRIPGLGKDFGFGYTFELDRHSQNITGAHAPAFLGPRAKTIEQIENLLSKSSDANVLLVADEGEGRHTILEGLALMINQWRVSPAIEFKRMVLVDFASLMALAKTKGNFEALVKKIMNEVVSAGNIILVLDDLPGDIISAQAIGSDLLGLIEPYISGLKIQVIAVSDRKNYHDRIEKLGKIAGLFTRVEPEELTEDSAIIILEEAALIFERKHGVFFTYQALEQVYDAADRYIVEGVMPEKAVLLLDEVGTAFGSKITRIISAEDVEKFITKKTGVPSRIVGEKEKKILLDLEDMLHERLVGQNEAVAQISEALRRIRSGLGPQNRPIGSFLFLGPTGVGKTETAKALAEIYFGGEQAIMRFDMSEYQDSDGVQKLIGGSSAGAGILASRIHEQPFGLVLLDEIEKASLDVLNIFLQILEEGFFSDASGKRISMRETMIIATSNAAAGTLLDLVRGGDDPAQNRSVIIDAVRREGKFTPELLNRFDAIVIYRSLSRQDLMKVARIMLEELAKKLKKQEIVFEISDALIDRVSKLGYDPSFGARPMRRVISEKIESIIAKKILADELKRGSKFSFSLEEIARL